MFPGIFYSFLHTYVALLPIVSQGAHSEQAVRDSIEQIVNDSDDVLFMLSPDDREDSAPPPCEMIFERILLHLLKFSRRGMQQEKILDCLSRLSEAVGWRTELFQAILYPSFMDAFPHLSSDAKICALRMCADQPVPEDQDLRFHMALTLADRIKTEEHIGVLSSASRFLQTLIRGWQWRPRDEWTASRVPASSCC